MAEESALFCCKKTGVLIKDSNLKFVLAGREKEKMEQEVNGIWFCIYHPPNIPIYWTL